MRPISPPRTYLFACALIFSSILLVGASLLGINGWSARSLEQRLGVFVTVAASAAVLAFSMVRQMVPGSRHTFSPAALPIAILAGLALVIASAFPRQEELAFVVTGLACMRNGLTYSLLAGVPFGLLLRRGAALFPKRIGAAAGGLAGLVGITVLEVNCPNLNVFHILVWHWGAVLISSLAGVALGAVVEYSGRWSGQRIS